MTTETTIRADDQLLSAYIAGNLPGLEVDDLIERLGREPHLAARLEFMRASDLAESTVMSSVYEEPRLPSVIRLIETTEPETTQERIATLVAPFFQRTVGIAAAAAFVAGVLIGGLMF